MPLYIVSVEIETIVSADTESAAREFAASNMEDCFMEGPFFADDLSAKKLGTRYPHGWDQECLPFGRKGLKTIRQILESEQ